MRLLTASSRGTKNKKTKPERKSLVRDVQVLLTKETYILSTKKMQYIASLFCKQRITNVHNHLQNLHFQVT